VKNPSWRKDKGMKGKKGSKKDFLRRDFIKTTAVGVGASALAGLDTKDAEAQKKQPVDSWDREADVVVAGYGGAGAVTAISAHDAGAKVLVVEKAPIEGGGCSRMAGAYTTYTEPENVTGAATYLYEACFGLTPMDVCQAWAEEIAQIDDWLTEMGIEWISSKGGGADFKNYPGGNSLKTLAIKGSGTAFLNGVNRNLKSRGIEILFDTPATELIQNPDTREIQGIKVKSKGRDQYIKARRAVVLCTGGFEFNEEMKNNYLRPCPIKFVGWKYNTGDGITMAQAVGADLWHMSLIASAGQTIVTPASEVGWMYPSAKGGSHIWVDRYGKRFACESPAWSGHRAYMGFDIWDWSNQQRKAGYLCIPFYLVFDEKTRLAGPIGNWSDPLGPMGAASIPAELGGIPEPWSKDSSREIELGWVKKGDTIRELAAAIGAEIDPAVLEESVARWNGFCAAGKDLDFGRAVRVANRWGGGSYRGLEAIDTPPFYGIEMYPGGFSTCGGPRKNGKSQVLDTKRNPIPRLYGAGSLGHSAGFAYSTIGQNWAELIAFGRIAGRNAAAEKPWS